MQTSGINLTHTQSSLLAKMMYSQTEHLAKLETMNDEKALAAAEILERLGLIQYTEDGAVVTDSGKEVMRDEGYLDDTDQLTTAGTNLLGADADQYAQPDTTPEFDDDFFAAESWSLIHEINHLIKLNS